MIWRSLRDVGRRLLGAADVGAADDLHQRDAGAVEVDEGHRRVHVVDRLAGVLLDMDALDPHPARDARPHVDQHLALADERVVELADLVALRQVGVEVVLAVERADQVDLRLEAEAGTHRLLDAELVEDGQHSRHRRVDEADVGVGLGAEFGRGAREELGPGADLGVDLEADDQFPVVPGAGDDLGLGRVVAEVEHGRSPCRLARVLSEAPQRDKGQRQAGFRANAARPSARFRRSGRARVARRGVLRHPPHAAVQRGLEPDHRCSGTCEPVCPSSPWRFCRWRDA